MKKKNGNKNYTNNFRKARQLRRLNRLIKNNPLIKTGHQINSSPYPSWYQRKKYAQAKISKLTHNQVQLLSSAYHGDQQRHWMTAACGHIFKASFAEIQKLKAGEFCPFCSGNPLDLYQFGSTKAIMDYVQKITNGKINFLVFNELGGLDDSYKFYCNNHWHSFEETFRNVANNREHSNGCPICMAESEQSSFRNTG